MAKVLIGNFKGPKGDTGAQGEQGDKGDTGARGSRWTEGTAITGSSTTPTVFSGTGITDALAEDLYLNTDTGNVYRCTTAGAANVAKWVYACNIKGIKGDTGSKGDKGDKGEQGEKGDTGAQGPKGDTPTVADDMTVAFTEADSRTNIASGENTATLFGKIKKWLADLAAAAFMQTITSYSDLMAGTAIADYLVNAKAVQDGFNTVNGKLNQKFYTNEYTTASVQNSFTDYINLPNGFTKSNCVVISIGIFLYDCYRFGNNVAGTSDKERILVEISKSNSFRIFSSYNANIKVKITFMRTDI